MTLHMLQEETGLKEYLMEAPEVLSELKSGGSGLGTEEAEARLKKFGPNKLAQPPKKTLLQRLLGELADPMILVLIAAAVVSGITAVYANESFSDVIIIMTVVILNAVLGVVQESKAEAAIEALQIMTAATCKVLRDGQQVTMESRLLVPGDVAVRPAAPARSLPALALAALQPRPVGYVSPRARAGPWRRPSRRCRPPTSSGFPAPSCCRTPCHAG